MRKRDVWSAMFVATFLTSSASGADLASPVPRFASLASDKVFMREGPTYRNRILWVYHRKGLPVEIVGQYDVWRRVRDSEGTTGWVHSAMIAESRTVIVTATKPAPLYRANDMRSPIIALAQVGVVAKLETCQAGLCEVDAEGTEGWIEKKNIWGVRPGESFR